MTALPKYILIESYQFITTANIVLSDLGVWKVSFPVVRFSVYLICSAIFIKHMEISSRELAETVSGEHSGDARNIEDVDSLDSAGGGDLAFSVHDTSEPITASEADVIICSRQIPDIENKTLIKVNDPRIAFHKIVNRYFMQHDEYIHPTAVISDGANIGDECRIGAFVYVHDNVVIGDECTILPGCSIGVEGNAFQRKEGMDYLNNIHKGEVVINDKVWIGANCAIDRAVFDKTIIGRDTKLQNLIHVGHNTHIGEHVVINQFCSLAGSVDVGDNVRIHPHVSVANHVSIGDDATLAMCSGVLDDVPAGRMVAGTPAEPMG